MTAEPARDAARQPLELGLEAEVAPAPDGLPACAHYGDAAAEHLRLLSGCGLIDRLWVEHLELTGADRARFLNGMVTADVKALEPGRGVWALFTTLKGRILAEARVRAAEESLQLELPAGRAAPIAEHLARYVVADRVEVAPQPEWRALALVGPAAPAVAAGLTGSAPPETAWSHRTAEWQGVELTLAREERLGGPAFTLCAPAVAAGRLAQALLAGAAGGEVAAVGWQAAEALRVESGLARFGPDFGEERFPQEVGAGEALDFDKGCYLGQEVVARIHYRGGVNHRLAGLLLGAGQLPAPGSAVRHDGGEAGRCGTAVRSPRLERSIALAVLHRRVAAGDEVEVDGRAAEVVELPF